MAKRSRQKHDHLTGHIRTGLPDVLKCHEMKQFVLKFPAWLNLLQSGNMAIISATKHALRSVTGTKQKDIQLSFRTLLQSFTYRKIKIFVYYCYIN